MNAFEMYAKSSAGEFVPTGLWACGKCKLVTLNPLWSSDDPRKNTREAAELCCTPKACSKCGTTEEVPRYSQLCRNCDREDSDRRSAATHAKRLAAAVDVTGNYDGAMVYCEELRGGHREGFFESVSEVLEYFEDTRRDDDDHPPEWVFATRADVRHLDIGDAIGRICEDGYEDMADMVADPSPELLAAAAKWNADNARMLTCYEVDYKRKIRVGVMAEESSPAR